MGDQEIFYCEVIDNQAPKPPPLPPRRNARSMQLNTGDKICTSQTSIKCCQHIFTTKELALLIAVVVFATLSATLLSIYLTTDKECMPCSCTNHSVMNECRNKPCHQNATCHPSNDSYNCPYNYGFSGNGLKRAARSCEELLKQGKNKSGIYYIDPDGEGGFIVSCDMQTDGGGWTVFQRRKDGSVDFHRGWNEYKNGFGEMNGEFWLGLDNIHRMTYDKVESLRVDLEDFESNKAYAKYSGFKVNNEGQQYRLYVWGYSGDAGDSLAWHNGMNFTTMDRDNDKASWGNCARFYGAWWYNKCHHSNLNGHYYNINPKQVSEGKGIQWKTWKGYHYSLKKCEIKLRCS